MQWSEAKAIVTGAHRPRVAVVDRIVAAGGGAAILRPAGRAARRQPRGWARRSPIVHCDVTNENEVKSAVTAALGQLGGSISS